MGSLKALGFVLGTGFASGLNVYATVAVLGLLERFGDIHSQASISFLGNPVVIAIALVLYVIEFVADKIPYFDNVWDIVHTFIRPFGAALLAYGATLGAPEEWRILAALTAGGTALTAHGTKATARAAINASPEPFSNSIVSVGEDAIAIFLAWMATAHPVLTTVMVLLLLGLCLFVLRKLFGILRKILRRFRRRLRVSAS